MELVQTLRQTTRLAMTQQMQQSLHLLQMSTAELSLYLEERARETPYLNVTLPRPVPRDLGPRPALGGIWDAGAQLPAPQGGLYAVCADKCDALFPDPRGRQLAQAFLDVLEPSGWLSQSLEAIAHAAGAPVAQAKAVLDVLHTIEPAGLFARSLSECLRLQAKAEGLLTWELDTLIDNLELLAEGRIDDLATLCDCAPDDVADIAAVLRGFDPKPGLQFDNDLPPVFPPDLIVRRDQGGWQVELTRSNLPTLSVAEESDGASDQDAVRAAQSEAKTLTAALEKRQATLLRVGAALLRHQEAYFENGPGHLRPLTLDIVAQDLGLHRSTISRVCAGRMMDTPRGAVLLKALFSPAADPALGAAGPSQDAILHRVLGLIAAEPANRPLSDAALVRALSQEGLHVARRTVAKYRGLLGIGPSSQRRRG